MPLLFSKSFGLVQAQDRAIAHKFCDSIGSLIDAKYTEDEIIKTVDAILVKIDKKDQSVIDAIKTELINCYPDIHWTFSVSIEQPSVIC